MRTFFLLFTCLGLAILLAGCPPAKPDGSNTGSAGQPGHTAALAAHGLCISFVYSDLGLGDGSFVREVDALLSDLANAGEITYQPVGDLPAELLIEASSFDVGLPGDGSQPGTMTLEAASVLLDEIQPCDWLVLSTPRLVAPALERIAAGMLEAEAVVVLDEDGWVEPEAEPPVPVIRVRYVIKDVAFMLGVAAAQSSNNGQFVALANEADPQASAFLDAVAAGAKYHTSGAVTFTATLPVDPATGVVEPEDFRTTIELIKSQVGAAFAANHYIVNLGRTTPTIMYSLTLSPTNGYVLGAYADYRQIRPARVVGCAVKHPAVALQYLLEHAATAEDLEALAPQQFIELGLTDGAVGFTDFDLYSRYNPDGDDIRESVENVENLIKADELDEEY